MQEPTPCEFPDHRAATGYGYGCRCDRCRDGWRLAAQIRRHGGAPVRFCLTCGDLLPTSRPKYCSEKCRGYERVEPTTGTCALPACHNLLISSFSRATWCSDACKQVGKKLKAGRLTLMHPHWLMSRSPLGPQLDECEVMSSPLLGPTLANWPMFGPTLSDWPMFAPTVVRRQCETCRKWFNGTGLACSRLCSDQYHKIVKTNASTPIATGHCRRCAKPYVRPASHDASGCCSPECTVRLRRSVRRREARARRQSVVHEPYTLREIAERDGWRCHLCGGKVPDRNYAARDKDPTIDHLIPQSAGGDDTRVNVALAHNRCNWERGNQGLAQLRLAG